MRILTGTTALALVMTASGAFATGVGVDAVPTATASSDPAATPTPTAATPTSAPDNGLEEIIVTAQHRGENLQRVAIPVTAISAQTLTNRVTNAESLGTLVPSLVIGQGGGGTNLVAIRGIGTIAPNGLTENAIAFNLDGVYLARPASANGQYFDLERIEVLKGPQGTLYGRNATAGAINMITRRPTFDLGGYVDAQVGNYNHVQAQGAINIPLSDIFALRIAGQGIRHDGYLTDGYDDQKQYSGRASLLIAPSKALSLLLSANYSKVEARGAANVLHPYVDPSNPYLGPSSPQEQAVYTGFPPFPLTPVKTDGYNNFRFFGASGDLEWDTGVGKLSILPSYRRTDLDYRHYAGGFQTNVNGEFSNQTILETRFATPDEHRLRATIGGFYFRESGGFSLNAIIAGPPTLLNVKNYTTRSLAAFGQATFDITSTLRAIGGLRYSNEKKSVLGSATGGNPVIGSLEQDHVDYRGGLEMDLTPRSFLYATVSTGFKAGGFYASTAPNTYEPETLTAYTVGTRNRFLDNRLQLNLEAYYWDYKNKQVTHLGPVRPSGFNLITENAGAATIYGAEFDTSYRATPNDLFSANILYNHTKYDRFVYNQSIVTGPPTTTCAIRPAAAGQAATTVNVDCSGNVLQQAPRWSINLGYNHTFQLSGDGTIVAGAAASFRTGYWVGDEHLVGQYQDSYIKGDFDLTYHAPRDRWHAGAFVQNVGNVAALSQSFVQPVLGRPVIGLYAPQTYGVRAGVEF